jgi:hypothetical protein
VTGTPDMRERKLVAAELRIKREWKSMPLAEIDVSIPPPQLSDELRAKLGCRVMEIAAK